MLNLDTRTQQWVYHADYYALGHASKFVVPGAYRIESNHAPDGSFENVAFQNPDGSIALIVQSSAMQPRPVRVSWRGRQLDHVLPPGAATTYLWEVSDA